MFVIITLIIIIIIPLKKEYFAEFRYFLPVSTVDECKARDS